MPGLFKLREIPPTAGMSLYLSDFFSTNTNLERGLENYFDKKTKIRLLSSGTAALIVILNALKKLSPQKDEVIIPAFTCPLVAIACNQAGLKIRLCDFEKESDQLDINLLNEIINDKTLCVIPTHLGFYPQKMQEILSLAKSKNIFVVEDAAQALGSTINQEKTGLLGDVGFFSLTAGKGLTIFEGGFIACANQVILDQLDQSINELASFDFFSEFLLSLKLIAYKFLYNPLALSIVYGAPLRANLKKGDEIKALDEVFSLQIPVRKVGSFRRAVGLSALKRLNEFTSEKKHHARILMSKLKELEGSGLNLVKESNVSIEGSFAYVLVRTKKDQLRDKILDSLWSQGLGVSKAFACELTAYKYLETLVPRISCPNAESFSRQTITISNSKYLSESDIDEIIALIKSQIKD